MSSHLGKYHTRHRAPGTGCSVIVWSYLHDVASLTGPVPAPGTTGSCAAECWCWCWRWQVYKFWVITQWSRPPPSLPRPNHCVRTVETEILSKYTFQRHRTRWGLVRAGQLGGVWPGSGCRGCVTPAECAATCPRINITTVLHCTVIHCTNTTARGQCYPLCCCCIIKISVQATMSPLISAGLWAAVAGLGWPGRALAGIFIELIRECWAYLIVYDGVQCWGWLLPRPALRLSCKPSLFIDMFYCGQSPGGGRGQGALAFKHGYFNSFPQINQLIIENCQI